MQMQMRIKQSEVYLKACVKLILGVFPTTQEPSHFLCFCGVQKNISGKKYQHVSKPTIGYLRTKYLEF